MAGGGGAAAQGDLVHSSRSSRCQRKAGLALQATASCTPRRLLKPPLGALPRLGSLVQQPRLPASRPLQPAEAATASSMAAVAAAAAAAAAATGLAAPRQESVPCCPSAELQRTAAARLDAVDALIATAPSMDEIAALPAAVADSLCSHLLPSMRKLAAMLQRVRTTKASGVKRAWCLLYDHHASAPRHPTPSCHQPLSAPLPLPFPPRLTRM